MPVDLQKAFVPVGMVGEQPIAIGVNKDVKANSVAELVELANDTSGGMLFGATNRGGQSHLTGELFRERSKANMSFVHAAGAAASVNDVIAGRIPIMFEGLAGLCAGNARRRHPCFSASRRRSACPIIRTFRRSTKPCRAWCRAAGS